MDVQQDIEFDESTAAVGSGPGSGGALLVAIAARFRESGHGLHLLQSNIALGPLRPGIARE